MTRNLTLSLSPDNLQLDIEVILPTDDLSASGLVTGGTTLREFIARSFNYLGINNESIDNSFREVTPIISITPADKENSISLTTVQASANLQIPTIKQGKLEKIELEDKFDQTDFLETIAMATDQLILLVDSYQMKSFSQVPDVLTEKKAIWKEKRQSFDKISVEVAPDSLRSSTEKANSWFTLLKISPSDLIPHPFSSLLSLLSNGLLVIPIVWLIRFSKQQTEMAQEVYSTILSKGLTICLVPSIIGIISSIQYPLANWDRVFNIFSNYFSFGSSVFNELNLYYDFFKIVSALLIWLFLPILIRLFVSLVNRFWRYFNHNSISTEICKIFDKSLDDACKLGVLVALLTPHTDIIIFNQIIATIWGVIYLNRVWNWFNNIYEEQVKASSLLLHKLQPLIFILGGIIVYPFDNFSSINSGFLTTLAYVEIFFERISQLIPYLALLGILLFLKEKDTGERNIVRTVITVCTIFFTCYLVGTTQNWFMIPIPFLLALRLFPRFVLVKSQMQQKLEQIKVELFQTEKRRELMSTLLSQLNPTKLSQALEKAENKVIAGELSIHDFRAKKTKIDQYIAEYNDRITLENGLSAEDIVLTFGPNPSNWENGLWAVRHGVWLTIPLLLIFLSGVREQIVLEVYIPLTVSIQLVTFIANWLLYSFFFGYFFSYIRGVSGVKKGLRISIVIVICLFPIKLISFANPTALVLWAGQIILFFTILGLWAFDYHTSKKVLREQFTWRKLFEFADLPTSTAFVSVLLASVGAATSSVLTGQFTTIVSIIVKAAFPDVPLPTPKG